MIGVRLLFAAAIVAPVVVQAQQPATTVVMLLTGDKAMVGTNAVATKDVVSQVTAERGTRTGMHMVEIRSCRNVPADTTQALMKELQTRKFLVVIDLKDPDPRLCSR